MVLLLEVPPFSTWPHMFQSTSPASYCGLRAVSQESEKGRLSLRRSIMFLLPLTVKVVLRPDLKKKKERDRQTVNMRKLRFREVKQKPE